MKISPGASTPKYVDSTVRLPFFVAPTTSPDPPYQEACSCSSAKNLLVYSLSSSNLHPRVSGVVKCISCTSRSLPHRAGMWPGLPLYTSFLSFTTRIPGVFWMKASASVSLLMCSSSKVMSAPTPSRWTWCSPDHIKARASFKPLQFLLIIWPPITSLVNRTVLQCFRLSVRPCRSAALNPTPARHCVLQSPIPFNWEQLRVVVLCCPSVRCSSRIVDVAHKQQPFAAKPCQ